MKLRLRVLFLFLVCTMLTLLIFYYNDEVNKVVLTKKRNMIPLLPSASEDTEIKFSDSKDITNISHLNLIDHKIIPLSQQPLYNDDNSPFTISDSQAMLFSVQSIQSTSTQHQHATPTATNRQIVIPRVHTVKSTSASPQQVTPSLKPTSTMGRRFCRYALCSSYWEQQTNAILNMFCFQRWASSVGLTVVEPFVHMSELKFSHELLHGDGTMSGALRLHDYIDIDYWNKRAKKSDVPPLESWKNFTQFSTKKIIVAIISYNVGTGGTFVGEEINYHPPCLKQKTLFFSDHSKLFNKLQFEVIRIVCVSFSDYYIISPENFTDSFEIDNEQQDVTLWLSEWQGVENGRVAFTGLGDNEFGRLNVDGGAGRLLSMIHPSQRLISDSRQYVKQIIGCDFDQYIAVVFRAKPREDRNQDGINFFHKCASKLNRYLTSFRINNSQSGFLSIDLGRFGDMVRADKFDYDKHGSYTGKGTKLFQKVLNIVYGNKSIESYENDFIQATNGVVDSGYVGAVQRTIAINARSLVIIGGHSSFQKTIVSNFKKRNHRSSIKYMCYRN
ncbi:uncharacterized protein [Dysidea avara]|uniref:uncharacterized protein n=1 Tax=Dysidea avara TaxID=196820 RepID=UPI00331F5961